MEDRPTVRALVGWMLPNGEFVVRKNVVSLEQAADYAQYGWAVLVDPMDESQLARWNQLHRTPEQPRRKW